MFANCLNNPVALDDVAGRYPSASVCVATFEHRGGAYLLFAGVSWRIGFDIVTFFEDMKEIFNE